jgi:diaminopimelate decarboxylase
MRLMELEASNHVTSSFETSEGCLVIGGMALPRLAERIGHTPFFAYSRDLITGRVAELRAALPPEIHLSYAIKANPMPAVVQHLAGLVDGFDVASALEMKVALDTTMPAERVSFAGPGKRPEEISQAIAAGVLISLESSTEMALAAAIGERLGIAPRVAVRINPEFELKASGMRMGGGAQPFGTDAEKIKSVRTGKGAYLKHRRRVRNSLLP